MESQFTNANVPIMGRFNTMDGFGTNEFENDPAQGGMVLPQQQ